MVDIEKGSHLPGPFTPTLIIHGGAGDITRHNLPPELYAQYEASLLTYLQSARRSLFSDSSALDAAVHAVSLMEDDPLFNCGRGSVFTEKGTIEMEASIMVASLDPNPQKDRQPRDDDMSRAARGKRGAGVTLVRNTRHPIRLAKEVLLMEPSARASSMHCQLSGLEVEEWGWKEKGLERMEDAWFWTKKRWVEHRRGLQGERFREQRKSDDAASPTRDHLGSQQSEEGGDKIWGADGEEDDDILPSQGTVGAVCMDSWGDVAVATSTGGLTNKKAGRIGDTPTLGAGFWAESWEQRYDAPVLNAVRAPLLRSFGDHETSTVADLAAQAIYQGLKNWLYPCLSIESNSNGYQQSSSTQESKFSSSNQVPGKTVVAEPRQPSAVSKMTLARYPMCSSSRARIHRHAVAISGTGNGDTFLRTAACRTTAALARFSCDTPSSRPLSLAEAMRSTAGPGGEMQKSAGARWKVTGDGEAGMIGIEVYREVMDDVENETSTGPVPRHAQRKALTVSDFNCGGLWRAFVDEETGNAKVMVFREAYH